MSAFLNSGHQTQSNLRSQHHCIASIAYKPCELVKAITLMSQLYPRSELTRSQSSRIVALKFLPFKPGEKPQPIKQYKGDNCQDNFIDQQQLIFL